MTKKTSPAVDRTPDRTTVTEACKLMGIHRVTLMALVERGDIRVDRDEDSRIIHVHV